jgi:hypothetical protein
VAVSSRAAAQLRIPGVSVPPPSCKWEMDPDVPLKHLESILVAASDQPVTYVRLLSGADTLVARFPQDWRPIDASVRVTSKRAGDWPFKIVCAHRHAVEGLGSHYVLAVDPSQLADDVWRVELAVAPTKDPFRVELFAPGRGLRENKQAASVDPWSTASGLLCIDGIAATEVRPAPSLGFSGRVKLHLDVAQDRRPITPAQTEALTALVLRAVSLWVVACSGCKPEHLAVVSVGEQQFMREEIKSWYASELQRGSPSKTRPVDLERRLAEKLQPVQVLAAGDQKWPRSKRLSQYRGYSRDEFVRLCALQVPSNRTTLKNIQRAICPNELLPREARATILIRFRSSSISCGNESDVIACHTDRELTEYNTRDFRFSFADARTPAIGTGAVELDLLHVIMHEMGHWIGLAHVDSEESIMASSLDTSRCIDMRTIKALVESQRRISAANLEPQAFTLNSKRYLLPRSTGYSGQPSSVSPAAAPKK